MLELYDLSQFQTWSTATNELHRTAYLETNAPVHRFVPFSTTPCENSRYYLYRHHDAGVCGSVQFSPLSQARIVAGETLEKGTWIIKDAYFFLPDDHFYSSGGRYEPLIRGFYQQMFLTVCSLSMWAEFPFALTYHRYTHEDLIHFGDFTLQTQWEKTDWINNQRAVLGLLRLDEQPHYTTLFLNRREHNLNSNMMRQHIVNNSFGTLCLNSD